MPDSLTDTLTETLVLTYLDVDSLEVLTTGHIQEDDGSLVACLAQDNVLAIRVTRDYGDYDIAAIVVYADIDNAEITLDALKARVSAALKLAHDDYIGQCYACA